ncbi:MAG: hypothetical protein AAB633_02300, partial [Patescibacteria group bacterium]
RGWELYVKNVRSYYIFILLFLAASLVVNFISTLYGPTIGTLLAKNWDELASFSLIAIPLFIILFYLELTVLSALNTRLENRSVNVSEALVGTVRRLPSALGAYVISVLPTLAGSLLLISLGVGIGKDAIRAPEFNISTAAIIGIIVGFVLLIVGIALLFWLFFSHLEALLAGKGPLAAIAASYRIVRGRWWALFGRILGTAIIISTVVYLINSILDWVTVDAIMVAVFKAGEEAQSIVKLISSTVLGVLVAPWGYGITMILYKTMRGS